MREITDFVFLAGMPRAGSTVLSALLSQNPKIHAEGMSAVCQLMWDVNVSCRDNCAEELIAANRGQTVVDLLASIPQVYYRQIDKPIIVDKNRAWCHPTNVEMIKRFISPAPRIIVLDRDLDEVMQSFVSLGRKNGVEIPEAELRVAGTNPVMSCYEAVQLARQNDNGEFLFIDYNDLVGDPRGTVQRIYEFCGWFEFAHDFVNIQPTYTDADGVYLLEGLHEVRSLELSER